MFYGYKNIRIICELNPVRTFINNRLNEAIPFTRIFVGLSIIDNMLLKIGHNDIEKILEDIHKLREQILYMLSFEKTAKENPDE